MGVVEFSIGIIKYSTVQLTELLLTRALLNLLRKGLGRSKPTTLPWNKHRQHNMWGFYYIQAPWTAFYRIKWAQQAWVS